MVTPGWAQPGDGGAGLPMDERVSTIAPLDKKGATAELVGFNQFNVFAGHVGLVPDGEIIVSICKRSQPDSKCRKIIIVRNQVFCT